MAAIYDTDDDAAAFTSSGNGDVSKAILPTGSMDDDELLSKVLPRVDTAAIRVARIAIAESDSESDNSDLEYARPHTRQSLSESSLLMGQGGGTVAAAAAAAAAAATERFDGFLDTAVERHERHGRHERHETAAPRSVQESVESSRPSRSLSRVDMVPQDYSNPPRRPYTTSRNEDREGVAVPARRSSRPDPAIDSPDRPAVRRRGSSRRDYNTPQRPPRADEIEAARRLLAQVSEAEEHSYRDDDDDDKGAEDYPPTVPRSATPPPIGGPRRRLILVDSDDDGDEDDDDDDDNGVTDQEEYHGYLHEPSRSSSRRRGNRDIVATPVTVIHNPIQEDTSEPHHRYTRDRTVTPRPSSRQSSQPPARSRAADALASHKRGLRTPVLDHNRLYHDAEPPPISQRRRPRNNSNGSTSNKPRTRSRPTTAAAAAAAAAAAVAPATIATTAYYRERPGMEEVVVHDYSVKSGLGGGGGGGGGPPAMLTPDYRPATADGRKTVTSDDSLSISRQSTSKQSVTSSGSSSRGADFFGPGIFQVALHNPTTVHQLLKFAETRFCSESVEFLKKVEQYQTVLNDLAGIMTSIHKDFLAEDSTKQINVNGELRKSVHAEMKSLVTKTLPSMETLFSELQESVEQDVFLDIYPRFVRSQMALSATRALSSNRHAYQGLGDCFCLTNPGLADNPIVFASDGFVKVTGYTRSEIIPRNCRFLQGQHTDRVPVRRLKAAINERKESVELILNYKKNGDPFWNLLYVAPLYNEAGKLAFFLGGQVNCSTTIHSKADVMRVLSVSNNDDVQDKVKDSKVKAPLPLPLHRASSAPSARKAFLKVLGVKVDDAHALTTSSVIDPGMESKLLHQLEGRDLNTQMKEFYTAYSKYLVVSYDAFIIRFYSEGVLDMLHPANNTIGLVAGQDVFRFLKQNMVNHQSDHKSRVRNALRAGGPVSVDVRLQTRRSALFRGDERFVTHWTPLKDEKSTVRWVVVTMSPAIS
ncbi:Blue-light-activated protein [Colletotrichum shisoi]|uniref:Blue-light-activated protein n=1 Tax=Colletotrichum shisoi TaxID=2078593 RepID=A0A5Q4BJH6_9PEZI|nr:Blue-light-activated protein [Colletotrichum shisoi]